MYNDHQVENWLFDIQMEGLSRKRIRILDEGSKGMGDDFRRFKT